MQVSDITNLVKYKMTQRGQLDRNTNRLSLSDFEIEAVATEVAVELSTRMSRPVVTFTRNDVLAAASQAGFQINTVRAETGDVMGYPIDTGGADVYDKLHNIIDWAFAVVLAKLPERDLQRETGR